MTMIIESVSATSVSICSTEFASMCCTTSRSCSVHTQDQSEIAELYAEPDQAAQL